MSNPKILVIGEKFIDRYFIGSASRLSPEAPIPVVKIDDEPLQFMGGAGNVAENLKVLGAKVQEMFQPGHYPIKNRLIAGHIQVARWDQHDSVTAIDVPNQVALAHYFNDLDGIIISDYNKGAITSKLIANVADKLGKAALFIDTKGSPSAYGILARNATFFPNMKEFAQYPNEYQALPRKVLKASERGMSYNYRNEPPIYQPSHAKQVVNVSGAGDTAVAAYAYAILTGKEPKEALEFASKACAVVCAKPYTATADHSEIMEIG